jgi:hypothetical protein
LVSEKLAEGCSIIVSSLVKGVNQVSSGIQGPAIVAKTGLDGAIKTPGKLFAKT